MEHEGVLYPSHFVSCSDIKNEKMKDFAERKVTLAISTNVKFLATW